MAETLKASAKEWDFHNVHVQQDINSAGRFTNAESVLVAATSPEPKNTTATAGAEIAYPMGLLENVGVSQSKQLQRVFEIGSSRSYFIPGRTVGSLSLGRVLYSGPSLLRVLYAHYDISDTKFGSNVLEGTGDMPTIKQAPGYADVFLNLGSDMFNQPTGLILYFKDQTEDDVAAIFLTNCYIQGHQLSVSSGSVLVMEGASAQFDRLVPVKIDKETKSPVATD